MPEISLKLEENGLLGRRSLRELPPQHAVRSTEDSLLIPDDSALRLLYYKL